MSKWLHMAMKARAPSAKAKLILICLADFADADGRAWPSQKALEAVSQLSERSVRSALAELERAGLIRREKRYRKGRNGGRTSDLCVLTLPEKPAGMTGSYRQDLPESHTGKICRKAILKVSKPLKNKRNTLTGKIRR